MYHLFPKGNTQVLRGRDFTRGDFNVDQHEAHIERDNRRKSRTSRGDGVRIFGFWIIPRLMKWKRTDRRTSRKGYAFSSPPTCLPHVGGHARFSAHKSVWSVSLKFSAATLGKTDLSPSRYFQLHLELGLVDTRMANGKKRQTRKKKRTESVVSCRNTSLRCDLDSVVWLFQLRLLAYYPYYSTLSLPISNILWLISVIARARSRYVRFSCFSRRLASSSVVVRKSNKIILAVFCFQEPCPRWRA